MDTSTASKELKLTCVGDGYIGKTCMLWSYVYRKFPKDYVPTVFESHAIKTQFNNEQYTLQLYDTAGQEDWETLRIMAYPETDVIILCFSVVRPDSMENVKNKWIPELKRYLANIPIILVGTQCDLRGVSASGNDTSSSNDKSTNLNTTSNSNSKPFSTQKEGEDLKNRIGAFSYIECSALTQHNIVDVFDSCIIAHIQSKLPKKRHLITRLLTCFGTRSSSPSTPPSSSTTKKKTHTSAKYRKQFN